MPTMGRFDRSRHKERSRLRVTLPAVSGARNRMTPYSFLLYLQASSRFIQLVRNRSLATSHTYHISKAINAPLRFVYNWRVDFREDDPKIWGSKTKRIILQKTKQQVIYMSTSRRRGKASSAVRIVTLKPSNAWHLDLAGQENDEIGDYHLMNLAPRKTKLEITFSGICT
jgi:hypothetical protein